MKKILDYSFEDEVSNKFFYDANNRRIEIGFDGYYDSSSGQYVDLPCTWIIKDWTDAKSKHRREDIYSDLECHLGIVSIILHIEISKDFLSLTVNTIDNRYIDLIFINPGVELKQ